MKYKSYTKEEIVFCLGLYNKSDDCVFPFLCNCPCCIDNWGAKHISFEVDKHVMRMIVEGGKI